jgi:MoxR-like ATPase
MSEKPLALDKFYQQVQESISKVIIGKDHVIQLITIGLLSQGHILIEDVPGVGKTVLARSLAKILGCTFKRIQFTPDMLPSDIVGVSIYNQKNQVFEFRPGPVMTQILLADEINRATPKTQSALLEAMEERQITVDGVSYVLPVPFMVMATQNPIEYEGTFPLPEAQLDRFLIKIQLGYPSASDEIRIMESQKLIHPINELSNVISQQELSDAQNLVKRIFVSDAIMKYIADLIHITRNHEDIYLGASPRGSLGLYRASQSRAAIHNRDFVLPEDIRSLFVSVLSHRIVISPKGRIAHLTPEQILHEIISSTPVPGDVSFKK